MDMKVCPRCERLYTDPAEEFCELDGALLVDRDSLAARFAGEPAGPSVPAARPGWRLSRETTVGLVVVLILAVVVGAFLLHRQASGFHVHVAFQEGHKLKVGHVVYLRGKEIGEVAATEFRNGKFVATLNIQPEDAEHLRQDCLFYIARDNILTGKMCVLVYVLEPDRPPLANGATVKGIDSWLELQGLLLSHWGKKKAEEILALIQPPRRE